MPITLYLAPDVTPSRWTFVSPGAVFAILVWLIASAGFAFYTSQFASYNKAWGSLAAVIIMLTWLWLSALALLLGAEINAETERSRVLRQSRPATGGPDAGGGEFDVVAWDRTTNPGEAK